MGERGTGTQAIRDALAAGALTFSELHGRLGGDEGKLRALVGYLAKKGEVTCVGRGDERSIALKAAGKPARSKRAKRTAKRKGRAKRGAARPLKALADRVERLPAPAPVIDRPARLRNHALMTLNALRLAIDVDGIAVNIDATPRELMLSVTFRAHEQALDLLTP